MTPRPHSCRDHGHVWREPDGTLYTRHRDRTGAVAGTCLYCGATATLPAFGKATMPFAQEVQQATARLQQDPAIRTKLGAAQAAFASSRASVKSTP